MENVLEFLCEERQELSVIMNNYNDTDLLSTIVS
jgi:hypothetical protein